LKVPVSLCLSWHLSSWGTRIFISAFSCFFPFS
jgi:hypothetical protein